MNITLYIDEATVKKVRKIAVDKGATLNAMVHEYLISVAESDTATRKEQADRLMASTERPARDMVPRGWTRDDAYEERIGRQVRMRSKP